MRLNALHPEDNPMETLLYCFGGDDDGDNGGGSAGDFDDSYNESMGYTGGYDADEAADAADRDAESSPSADTQDSQMDELDAIAEQFDAIDAAEAAGQSYAIGSDDSVNVAGSEGYDAIADTYEGLTGDDSITAGYPTGELTTGIGDTIVSALLGEKGVGPEQISDIYSSLLNTAQKAEELYSPAQPNYVEKDIYGYDYPDYTPTVDIGDTSLYGPEFYDDDTGDTGLSGFISQAFDENNLAVKNNNPGNLKYAGQPGATEDARGFAKFEDPQAGMNALVNQINLDRSRGDTLEEFISDYAPPSENATQDYIDYVSQRTGIAPGEQIPADKVASVAGAITQMEGGDLSTDYFSSAQDMYQNLQQDGEGIEVEIEFDGQGTDYRDTFVAQDRIGQGFPVTALPEGSYKLDPETSTVALNELGREYMDALKKGINNEPNPYGIDRQEIESLMAQGEVVGSPVVNITATGFSFEDKREGGEAPAGSGEDEAGLAGSMGGEGRLGDTEVTQEGVDNDFFYEIPYYQPSETGEQPPQVASTQSGLGISPDAGGVGLMPGAGGVIGTDTDSGLVGQSGAGSINPFTEGGGGGEGEETSTLPGVGQGDVGSGGGSGGAGTGVQPEPEVADAGDSGDNTPAPAVIPEDPSEPYSFGDALTYDPDLPPFDYRTPLVTQPYDFMRDFGAYTLSEPIAERFAERALLAPEGLTPYTPEYMEPISEMDLARQEELLALIGERFPGEFGGFTYDTSLSPLESAQALIDSLGNQSS